MVWGMRWGKGSTYGPATVGTVVSIVCSLGYGVRPYLGRRLLFVWLGALTSWSGKGGSSLGVWMHCTRVLGDNEVLSLGISFVGGSDSSMIVSLGLGVRVWRTSGRSISSISVLLEHDVLDDVGPSMTLS